MLSASSCNVAVATVRSMRNQLRVLLQSWKVSPYTRLRAADHRNWAYDRLSKRIATLADHTILAGPYKGMKYFGLNGVPVVDPLPTAKFLGSFEEELHPWIERLIKSGFRRIVHVGAGEGYHVVGMAQRLPQAHSIVFDTLIAARKACRSLAEQNRVRERMQLRGFCGGDAFLDIELPGSLIFSDCGGAELVLLDPQLHPSLAAATMLVETHDAFDARITPRLLSRFCRTHTVEFVAVLPRNPARFPLLRQFPEATAQMALDENRDVAADGKPQTWALFTPKLS